MKSVIINADDFGLSPGVNRGILTCFHDGVLTSTTMLANLAAFDDAVAVARANPDMPVGVHLSLLWGAPVSDPADVPTLVDGSGSFCRAASTLARRYFLGGLSKAEIHAEFRSQVRRVMDAGITPTHLDSHKHIHCLRGIRHAMLEVAGECGIERVRLPLERPGPASWRSGLKRAGVAWLGRHAGDDLRTAGIRTTDHFIGISCGDRFDTDTLCSILKCLDEGTTEIMCHPGCVDPELRQYVTHPDRREVELAALTDRRVREEIESGGVRLVNFGDL